MRSVHFARLGERDYRHEVRYSLRNWGRQRAAEARQHFRSKWREIADDPARAGEAVGLGRFRSRMAKEKLWVLYRWLGGTDEDPLIVAVVSQRLVRVAAAAMVTLPVGVAAQSRMWPGPLRTPAVTVQADFAAAGGEL